MVLDAGRTIHRLHDQRFGATTFNPGFGATRFAPISSGDGSTIPTSYAGTSFACAAFESVFHDIDPVAPFKTVTMRAISALMYSEIRLIRDLRLARLFEPDLNRWGHSRRNLIHTPSSTYPATRLWSAAIHDCDHTLDGMIWTSRKYDPEQVLLLFGTRVASEDLEVIASTHIASSAAWLEEIRALGKRADIVLTV
ncbi:RES family NAD+ phosphorylase [Microvirga sp. Mcv34]|uniref:RES family NAD+ phosphorylase n=1 Tax=Microvirga sp. Mcv34 TaxID=2926016 RepID=UPI0021C655F3|nr:RES family NAD+ phosphorylase [Microvirga sp. Mcv34]